MDFRVQRRGRRVHDFLGRDLTVLTFGVTSFLASLYSAGGGGPEDFPKRRFGYGSIECRAVASAVWRVVIGSSDGGVRIWNLSEDKLVRTFSGHGRRVEAVAFSADGRVAASCDCEGVLKLWNVATGENEWSSRVQGGEEGFCAVFLAFAGDGAELLAATRYGVEVRNATTGDMVRRFTVSGGAGVKDVVFSRDGRKVMYVSGENLRVFDVETGRLIRRFFVYRDGDHRDLYDQSTTGRR